MGGFLRRRVASRRAPIWLWLFAAVSVGTVVASTVWGGFTPFFAPILAFAVVFSWLILRGGRVVWCFAVLSGLVGVVGLAWGEPVWRAALAALQLALLLAPSSWAYVWHESPRRRALSAEEEADGFAARAASGVLWGEIWAWVGDRAVNWKFIGRLALFFLAMTVVSGWLHSVRDDGWVLAVLYRVAAILQVSALLLLIGLLIAVGVNWMARRLSPEA